MHCRRFREMPLSRREMLASCANGFGAVALAALLGEEARADTKAMANPMAPRPGHFAAKTKSIIFLFMDGGPSHIDTFDPKPRLTKEHGQPYQGTIQPSQFMSRGAVLKSPWEFKPYGQSGVPVSDLFPHVGTCVDNLTVIRSMFSDHPEHTNANFFLHSGLGVSPQ